MTKIDLLLGIDIGTTNCEILICDIKGNIIADYIHIIPNIYKNSSIAEQNPNCLWSIIKKGINICIKKYNIDSHLIKAISVDSNLEAWICIDKRGKAISNGILWLDKRTVDIANEIKNKLNNNLTINRTGVPINYVNTVCKILWTKKNKPEIFDKTLILLSPKDYINYRLTGEVSTDVTVASKTMLSSIDKNEWVDEIINKLGIDKTMLPPIKWPTDVLGTLAKRPADELSLPCGIPVAVGAGDDHCQALSAGAIDSGDLNIGTGTGSSWKAVTTTKMFDYTGNLELHKYFEDKKWIIWTGINTTGYSIEWFVKTFGRGEKLFLERINKRILRIEAGSNGLFYYPYLWGARIPKINPKAKAIFWGINSQHTIDHFYRSVLEGIAFNYVDAFRKIQNIGLNINKITMVGGEVKNKQWNQIKADVLGKPIYLPRNNKGSVFGSIMVAGISVGIYSSIEDAIKTTVKLDTIIKPNISKHLLYENISNEYLNIYRKIESEFK